MHRGYVLIIMLLISSLACGLFTTVTPKSTPSITPLQIEPSSTIAPTKPVSTATPADTEAPGTVPSQTPTAGTAATSTQEEQTKTPYPTSVLDKALSQEINLIQSQVIENRGLQPKFQVPVVLLYPDAFRQNVINDFLADYTDENISDDLLELSILGLLDPNFDLRKFYIDLYSEQIAGYYDSDVSEMFVIQGQGFEGPERMTYAHEFTHVLQDQNYDFEHGMNYNDESCEADSERCAAILGLIEGDATLSELDWVQYYATRQDQLQIVQFYKDFKSPVYDSAPDFMKDDFGFPYTQGYAFVQALFDKGGWSAVDDAYHNPPVSTEQIMHPDLYPSDTPIHVEIPDVISGLGDGWHELSHGQMGEWYTYLILARGINTDARLDDKTAQAAAAGWGGDEYLLLHNDSANGTAFLLKTAWDTANDAGEFANAVVRYGNTRFGVKVNTQGSTSTWTYQGGYAILYRSGDTTVWIIAPDAQSGQTIFDLVQPKK